MSLESLYWVVILFFLFWVLSYCTHSFFKNQTLSFQLLYSDFLVIYTLVFLGLYEFEVLACFTVFWENNTSRQNPVFNVLSQILDIGELRLQYFVGTEFQTIGPSTSVKTFDTMCFFRKPILDSRSLRLVLGRNHMKPWVLGRNIRVSRCCRWLPYCLIFRLRLWHIFWVCFTVIGW